MQNSLRYEKRIIFAKTLYNKKMNIKNGQSAQWNKK